MKNGLSTFLILITLSTFSQSTYVSGIFPTIDHSGKLSEKFGYSLYYFAAFPLIDLQTPNNFKNGHFNLLYFEQAISYKLLKSIDLTEAYVYQIENVVYPNFVNEQRFHVQLKHKAKIKKANLVNRMRFDGRFISTRTSDMVTFSNRLRYLIGFDTPINSKFYLAAYQEAFFNTFKNATAIYAENWAYAAIGKILNSKNKIEAGLLYITWNTGIKSWFHQYYLQVTWLNNINFSKTN